MIGSLAASERSSLVLGTGRNRTTSVAWVVPVAAAVAAAVEAVPAVAAAAIAVGLPERDCSAAAVVAAVVVVVEESVLVGVATCIEPGGIDVVPPHFDIADIAFHHSEPSVELESGNLVVALECSTRPVFVRCLAEKMLPTCFLGCCRGCGQAGAAETASG